MADNAPSVSRELLDYLSRTYPDRCPDIETPDREVWMDAGAARVVRTLRSAYERQTKSLLENPSR